MLTRTPINGHLNQTARRIEQHWTEAFVINAWHDQQGYPPYRLAVWLESWYRDFGLRPSSHNLTGYRWVGTGIGQGIIRTAEEMTITDLVEADDDHRFVAGFEDRLDDFRANLRLLCAGTLRDLITQGAADPGACTDRYWDGVLNHPQLIRGWDVATKQILSWLDTDVTERAA
jgi:hypothetical protein